ncbi:MAG: hypothetical protein WC373_06660 [Smithella sp.]|jgi:hypothetical protein
MVQEMKHVTGYKYICKVPFNNATIRMFDGKIFAFSPNKQPHYLDFDAMEFKKIEVMNNHITIEDKVGIK